MSANSENLELRPCHRWCLFCVRTRTDASMGRRIGYSAVQTIPSINLWERVTCNSILNAQATSVIPEPEAWTSDSDNKIWGWGACYSRTRSCLWLAFWYFVHHHGLSPFNMIFKIPHYNIIHFGYWVFWQALPFRAQGPCFTWLTLIPAVPSPWILLGSISRA